MATDLQNPRVQKILHSKAFAFLSTIGPHGEPHNSPVWFVWDGEYLKFTLNSKRQKLLNIQRDPCVAVSIIDLDNPYTYAEFRGVAARVEDDPTDAFFNQLAERYDLPLRSPGDQRVVLSIKIEHVSGQNL